MFERLSQDLFLCFLLISFLLSGVHALDDGFHLWPDLLEASMCRSELGWLHSLCSLE